MSESEKARARRQSVELLEELQSAGLLTLHLEHRNWEGSNPHIEINARPEDLTRNAPRTVSLKAGRVWNLLRTGKLREAAEGSGIVKLEFHREGSEHA